MVGGPAVTVAAFVANEGLLALRVDCTAYSGDMAVTGRALGGEERISIARAEALGHDPP